jgi:uncharacterized protein (DUF924 family)
MHLTEEVLSFCFGQADISPESELKPRKIWFKSSSSFDKKVNGSFIDSCKNALDGHLDHMNESQESCLALIILLDQFPRNLFRESPKAFAGDVKALKFANYAISQGFDKNINRVAKLFFYLPLEHSEIISDQEKGLKLINGINDKRVSKAATEHHKVIKRFGRFPHRNAVLGRENTPEEIIYLKNPPAW